MKEIYIVGLIIIIIGVMISATSYNRLLRIYNKYNTLAYVNITALQFVAGAFEYLNLPHYKIAISEKPFSDAYNFKKNIVILSSQNANSKTISSLSIAAHEVGHIMQKQDGSGLFAISYLLKLLNKVASAFLIPILLLAIGLIFFSASYVSLGNTLLTVAIILYIITFLLKVVTIPLEIDASKRALKLLKNERILDSEELVGAKKVLRAAALTYVGGLFYNIYRILKGISRSFS